MWLILTCAIAGGFLSLLAVAVANREVPEEEHRVSPWLLWGLGALASGAVLPVLMQHNTVVKRDVALFATALVFAVVDAYCRIIPNLLTISAAVVGFMVWTLHGQPISTLLGIVLAVLVFLPGVLLGQMGAGDLKAAASLGAIAGWPLAAYGVAIEDPMNRGLKGQPAAGGIGEGGKR